MHIELHRKDKTPSHIANIKITDASSLQEAVHKSFVCIQTAAKGSHGLVTTPSWHPLLKGAVGASTCDDIFRVCGVDYTFIDGSLQEVAKPKDENSPSPKLKFTGLHLDSDPSAEYSFLNEFTFDFKLPVVIFSSTNRPKEIEETVEMRVSIEGCKTSATSTVRVVYLKDGAPFNQIPREYPSKSSSEQQVVFSQDSISIYFDPIFCEQNKLSPESFYINVQDECVFYESFIQSDEDTSDDERIDYEGSDGYTEDFSEWLYPDV